MATTLARCCCGPPGPPCTPPGTFLDCDHIDVTIDGLTLCNNCWTRDGITWRVTSHNLHGTFTLDRFSPATWVATVVNGMTYDYWFGESCDGAPAGSFSLDVRLQLEILATGVPPDTTYELLVTVMDLGESFGSFLEVYMPYECLEQIVSEPLPNDATQCCDRDEDPCAAETPHLPKPVVAYGGTIVLSNCVVDEEEA